jgi:hypothetical protein
VAIGFFCGLRVAMDEEKTGELPYCRKVHRFQFVPPEIDQDYDAW